MESVDIKKLSEKNFSLDDKKNIEKEYEISFGTYDKYELKKAIDEKKPFYLKNKFVIGYENNKFIDDKNNSFPVERLVKAVIIENIKDEPEEIDNTGDYFAIINKNDWEDPIPEFMSIISPLKIGEIYLPPHSAVFNFVKPTKKMVEEKIVSMLEGVNINVYSRDNYFDNILHEMGHLFWRTCLNHDEKQAFKKHFEYLPPSAIFEYSWERSDEEEVFCTVYKFFLKSILLNQSFYNILSYEEPEGLKLLEKVFERKAKDKMINDIWELEHENVFKYINPRGKVIVKKGTFDSIKDVELPDELLNDVNKFEDGVMYINLHKAVVPVNGNKIDWEEMEKAKFIRKEPDGKGGFKYIYKEDGKKKVEKVKQTETKNIHIDHSNGIVSRYGAIEETGSKASSRCDILDTVLENKEFENCGAFDKDGTLVFQKEGDDNFIEFTPEETKKMVGLEIFTHNHPKGGSFSLADVVFALKVGIKEIRSVGDQGRYVLKINYKNPVKTNQEMVDKLRVIANQYNVSNEIVREKFWGKIDDGKLNEDEAALKHNDEVWKRVFSDEDVKKVFNIQYQKK